MAEHFGVSVADLGLTQQKIGGPRRPADRDPALTLVPAATAPEPDPVVQQSQRDWLAVRDALNRSRRGLAVAASKLYADNVRVGGTGLVADHGWLLPAPLPLDAVGIKRISDSAPTVLGTERETAAVRPLTKPERRSPRYSLAMRDVARPRLLENRVSYRLLTAKARPTGISLGFGTSTYFNGLDVAEALAHELAMDAMTDDGLTTPSMRRLRLRQLVGDPFDLRRRPVLLSIDTLTIRRSADGPSFVLHQRSAGSVAVAGGMLHIMPAGVFQPSSIEPDAQTNDFSLWRNIMREYSEEFLGRPEHDGDGAPARYDIEPLSSLDQAMAGRSIRPYLLGIALDALTLWCEMLTVVVIDAPAYDELFADMVDTNDEGVVVKTGQARPTPQLPFTEQVVMELLAGGRLAPAAAGCLDLAWRHRRTILEGS